MFFLILQILFPKSGFQERVMRDGQVGKEGCGHGLSLSV